MKFLWLCFILMGCQTHPATQKDCETLVDRLVDVELSNRGFNDPVLTQKKRSYFRMQFADEIAHCIGRPLYKNSLTCTKTAPSTEAIAHQCLHR